MALSCLFAALAVGLCGGATEQDPGPKGPEAVRLLLARYRGEIRLAKLTMQLKRNQARMRCLTALSVALDKAIADRDPECAEAARRAIASLDASAPTREPRPDRPNCNRVCGRYHAFHQHWFGELRLAPNGRFHDGNEWRGRWILRGRELYLLWKRYPAELLLDQGDGYRFSSPNYRFVLIRMRPAGGRRPGRR